MDEGLVTLSKLKNLNKLRKLELVSTNHCKDIFS
jgi:hypothetical protein